MTLEAWLRKKHACLTERSKVLSLAKTLPELVRVLKNPTMGQRYQMVECSPGCEQCRDYWKDYTIEGSNQKIEDWLEWVEKNLNLPDSRLDTVIWALFEEGVW